MKKHRFLLSAFMAIVMMAMSPMKSWAEDDPRLSALTLGEGVTATFTDEDGKTPWVVTTEGEELYEGPALPADYVPGLRSNIVGVNSRASATNITLTSEKDFDLSFKAYCSSEGVNWDYMRVYVDGRDEEHRVCKIGGSSDNVYTFSQTMTAGTHTLRFLYEKDNMDSGGYDCGFIYNFMAIVPCNPGEHNLSTHVAAQTATCTAAGNVEYWQCSICNNYYSDSNGNTKLNESEIIIPALGHDLDANGACTRCDYSEPTMTEGDNTIQIGAVAGDKSEASAYQLYRYVPAKSGKLTVKSSTSGSGDTFGSLWNSDLSTRLTYDDDSAGSSQFLFTYDVTAQTVYYIGVRSYGGGALSGNFVINVYLDVPCDIDNHTMTLHEANNPTCSARGNEAYYECSVCGRLYSDIRGENLLSGIPYIPALGHILDENKLCSRCGKTITQLDGTPFDLANYTQAPINVYSDRFESGSVTQTYTGNLIFTGTGNQMINLYDMPATGKLALRDATINVSNPAILFNDNTTEFELVIEGNVSIYGGSGALYASANSNVTVNGPGNLSISSNSSSGTIYGTFAKLDIDIEGDFTLEGGAFANSSGYEMNINAKSITANGTGSQPFIENARNATLHAKGNILLESISTANQYSNSYDKIWCIKSIDSDEGTVLLRMCKGGVHESVGVKAGYAGIPAVSTGNTIFSVFTWKVVDKTTGAATFYGCDPKDFPAITSTTDYDAYISLVKDSEGNTVFDVANLNNGPINLYDGHFSNNAFSNICWEGHPVFTGTDSTNKMLIFSEPLSAANTPILRNLTISTSGSCLSGSNVAAIIDGNVSLSTGGSVISASSCTITGNGSLTLRGSGYIYSCPDLNIDIKGDLVGSTSSGATLQEYSFDFSKLKANSIAFRANTGSNAEQAIIMPTPSTAPATYDSSTTYPVKLVDNAGSTIWYINYDRAMVYVATNLDGTVTVVDENQFGTEAALSLSDAADFDKSGYSSKTFYVPSVRYERTMTNNWGTIMMPFEMHSNSDVQYYTVTDVNLSAGTMTVAPVDVVYPGHPCLFKRLTSGNLNLNSDSKALVCTSTFGLEVNDDWTLTGEYNALTLDATTSSNDYYYISADQFWHATGTVDVKPYRAYFIGEAPASEARAISIAVEEDGVSSIEAVMDVDGNIYDASEDAFDLSGRRISEGQRGLQIKNGRVVMMK